MGKLSLSLGAGKLKKNQRIDHSVGIKLNKLVGDSVKKGDVLMTLYVNKDTPDVNIEDIFTIEWKKYLILK